RLVRLSGGGDADGAADRGKRLVGVAAQRGDGPDTHNDDESQHDRVLDGGRAVFLIDEVRHVSDDLSHLSSPFGSGERFRDIASGATARWLPHKARCPWVLVPGMACKIRTSICCRQGNGQLILESSVLPAGTCMGSKAVSCRPSRAA